MKFPERGTKKEALLQMLLQIQEQNTSFMSGRILGSMCAKPVDISIKAYNIFIESNLGNPGLYPGTQKLEKEVVGMLGDLLGNRRVFGRVLSGGTEANITALWQYRNIWKKSEVLLPLNAHFSLKKGCDLLRLKPRTLKLDKNYTMDIRDLKRKISKNTLCVVAVAGSTELGTVDNIPEIGEICEKEGIPLHVDAAFGGFVIPFLQRLGYSIPDFDFRVRGVTSITIDPHKMGQSVMPSGVLLTRENYWESIGFSTPYLTSEVQSSLLGTRASGAVAGTYAAIKFFGREGYTDLVRYCMDLTEECVKIAGSYGISPVIKPVMNILGLRIKDARKIVRKLWQHKFFVSYGELTKSMRLVLMPYIKKKNLELLFKVINKCP